MRWATRLIPSASATELPPYFCTTMPTNCSSGRLGRADRARRGPVESTGGGPWDRRGLRFAGLQYLLSGGHVVLLALEVRVQAVVRHDRLQGPQRRARLVAPGGDVGELPPPQRLGDAARLEVPESVRECRRDGRQVVGEETRDDLGGLDVGVEDLAVGVDATEQYGEPQPHVVEVRGRAGVRFVLLRRLEVLLPAETATDRQHLADDQQQQGEGFSPAGLACGDRTQGEQERLDLVRDALSELGGLGV